MKEQHCHSGVIYCQYCIKTIYCNECPRIDITGENKVEIFAYDVEFITCKKGCRATINVFKVGDVSCSNNCSMVLNAYDAGSVSCYRDCNATVRVSTGTDITCAPGECHITTMFHNNFTQFCLNSGFGYPLTTESSITTTSLATTTVKSQETTTFIVTTEQAYTGRALLLVRPHVLLCYIDQFS